MKKKNFLGIIAMIVIVAMVGFAFAACGSPSGDPPAAQDVVVDIAAIGVTAPVSGGEPATAIAAHTQVTGVITWANDDGAPAGENFDIETVYIATITLTARDGFTLTGVANGFFNVAGATTVTSVGGVVTATFPATDGPTMVDIAEIVVTAPASGGVPAEYITHAQVYGTIEWASDDGAPAGENFDINTVYIATITLTARTGYTLVGVDEGFFEVDGAYPVTSTEVEGGTITVIAEFPQTEGPTQVYIYAIGVTRPVWGAVPAEYIYEHPQVYGTIIRWEDDCNGGLAGDRFKEETSYIAIITITARTGFTLVGVPREFFRVAGTNFLDHLEVNQDGEIEVFAQFPQTAGPTQVDIPEINITAPVTGQYPQFTINDHPQVTGTIWWQNQSNGSTVQSGETFAANTVFYAFVGLTARDGFTLAGVTEGFFTVAGANFASSQHSPWNPEAEMEMEVNFSRTAPLPLSGTLGDFITLIDFEPRPAWLDAPIAEGPFAAIGPLQATAGPTVEWVNHNGSLAIRMSGRTSYRDGIDLLNSVLDFEFRDVISVTGSFTGNTTYGGIAQNLHTLNWMPRAQADIGIGVSTPVTSTYSLLEGDPAILRTNSPPGIRIHTVHWGVGTPLAEHVVFYIHSIEINRRGPPTGSVQTIFDMADHFGTAVNNAAVNIPGFLGSIGANAARWVTNGDGTFRIQVNTGNTIGLRVIGTNFLADDLLTVTGRVPITTPGTGGVAAVRAGGWDPALFWHDLGGFSGIRHFNESHALQTAHVTATGVHIQLNRNTAQPPNVVAPHFYIDSLVVTGFRMDD